MATPLQINGAGNNGSYSGTQTISIAVTLSTLTLGNLVVIRVGVSDPFVAGAITTPVVSDSLLNVYTQGFWDDAHFEDGGTVGAFYAVNATDSASTVTFTFQFLFTASIGASGLSYAICVAEYPASAISTPSLVYGNVVQLYGGPGGNPIPMSFVDSFNANVTVTFPGPQGPNGGPGPVCAVGLLDLSGLAGSVATESLFACCFNVTTTPFTPTSNSFFTAFSLTQTTNTPSGLPALFCWDSTLLSVPAGWLMIREPSTGLTDQSARMFNGVGHKNSWSNELRQRGKATIHMVIYRSDTYTPTRGAPVYLFDQVPAGFVICWSGLILDFESDYTAGTAGEHYYIITCVSWEMVYDTVYSKPMLYVNQTCAAIMADLLQRYETGSGVAYGTIQANQTLAQFNTKKGDKISELADSLATTDQFIWKVDINQPNPYVPAFYYGPPSLLPAPFTLTSDKIQWETPNYKQNGLDYRNRQAVRIDFSAQGFSNSMEFFVGAGQQSFTLMRPVNQVVHAYITLSTCNTATATFTGQPNNGDTVTIGPLAQAWADGVIYGMGAAIVEDGIVQTLVIPSGLVTSGSAPAWLNVLDDRTTDTHNGDIWECQGPSGLATGTQTYTFVTTLDNTQFGQVLIDSSAAATAQNLAYAINATADNGGSPVTVYAGIKYSLPTWENTQCNAISVTSSGFTLQQKAAGAGWIAQLSESATNFSWSAPQTSGGTSPQGSVGPNETATIDIQAYPQGTSTAAPGVAYTVGSAVITLATPLNSGTNLNIEYTRADGDVIECEDTALVAALAAVTHGTGKVQQLTDMSSSGLLSTSAAAALLFCQQTLAAYSVAPNEFTFQTYLTGLYVGMTLPASLSLPTGSGGFFNASDWVIETIEATLVPGVVYGSANPWLYGPLGYGHYLLTVTCYNIQQVDGDWAFWARMGGGSSGGSGGSGLVATSGGAVSTAASQTGFASPLTTKGDILGFDTAADRIPVGADGTVLTANSAQPLGVDWAAVLTNPMTNVGDIIVGGTAGAATRLGIGGSGQVLTVSGGTPDWATAGGTGLFAGIMSALPTRAAFGLTNNLNQQGTFTQSDNAVGFSLNDTTGAGGDHIEGIYTSYPGSPFTMIWLQATPIAFGANDWNGLIVFASTTGKVMGFAADGAGSSAFAYSTPNTFSSTLATFNHNSYPYKWCKYKDDGTNIQFWISTDGIIWDSVYGPISKTSSYLGSSGFVFLGFGINIFNALCSLTVMSLVQTFP
jgi:hypothetical protein